jgi:hypothetical protein
MGFFNILNIKWNIIILLSIVLKKSTFITLKKIMATCNFFDKEQWIVYFILLLPQTY